MTGSAPRRGPDPGRRRSRFLGPCRTAAMESRIIQGPQQDRSIRSVGARLSSDSKAAAPARGRSTFDTGNTRDDYHDQLDRLLVRPPLRRRRLQVRLPERGGLLLRRLLRLLQVRLQLRHRMLLRRLHLRAVTPIRLPPRLPHLRSRGEARHTYQPGPIMERQDVIIIGGGQAGLALGYHLARRGLRFHIIDGADSVGASWRCRWDSLRLFTPARYSGLPGMAFPDEPDALPARDEVAAYLATYAVAFDLPLRFGEKVLEVVADGSRGYRVRTSVDVHLTDQVVIATGPFQQPLIPSVAAQLSRRVPQLHSRDYRRPDQLPDGDVLVVGGGNSGVQIAAELSAGRSTTLAVGQRLTRIPERLLGRSIFWWLDRAGWMSIEADSWLGRRVRGRELLVGTGPAELARAGVNVVGRITAADDESLMTEDGSRIRPSAVVWATGYRSDYSWVNVPVFSPAGLPVHRRGVTTAPGLYFLGLPWQHTRGSALIGGVGRDAAFLAGQIDACHTARLRRAVTPWSHPRPARRAPESPTAHPA